MAADVRAVDVELNAGDVAEMVTVEGVMVIGGEVSGLIAGEQAHELPVNGFYLLQSATLVSASAYRTSEPLRTKGGVAENLVTVDAPPESHPTRD